jgi:hypothetical protein
VLQVIAAMAKLHVTRTLHAKRAELAGTVSQLERRRMQQRASLTRLDATLRLFDPDIRPQDNRPKQQRAHSRWFRNGDCLRLIYDELRDTHTNRRRRASSPNESCGSSSSRRLTTAVGIWCRERCSVR